jgi:hypothetical protein
MVKDDRVKEVTVVVRPMQYLLARGAGDQGTEMELENLPEEGIHQSLFAEAATSYIRMTNEFSDLRSVKLLEQVRILG